MRFLSGIRHGKTIGSPIAMMVENLDWPNWEETMSVREVSAEAAQKRTVTRRGLAHRSGGSLKFNHVDARNILERPAPRNDHARRCRRSRFPPSFRDRFWSYTAIGTVSVPSDFAVTWEQLEFIRNDDIVRCPSRIFPTPAVKGKKAQKEGDTIGGTFEVIARGVPTGWDRTAWDTRLDGQLAQAMCRSTP